MGQWKLALLCGVAIGSLHASAFSQGGGTNAVEVQAETLNVTNTGFIVQNISGVPGVSQVIAIPDLAGVDPDIGLVSLSPTSISPGTYDVAITYFDESDGNSTLELRVDGATVGSIVLNGNSDTSGNFSGSQPENVRTTTLSDVVIGSGDSISLFGRRDADEFVRVDKLVFTPISQSTPPLSSDISLHLIDPATNQRVTLLQDGGTIDPNDLQGTNYNIEVTYSGANPVGSVQITRPDGMVQTETNPPYSVFGDNSVTGTFNNDEALPSVGTALPFVVRVFDAPSGNGNVIAEQTFNLTVGSSSAPPQNTPPSSGGIPNQSVTAGEAFTPIDLTQFFTDAENDSFTIRF
ncbi:MAG: hypothetical protein AAF292_16855, partial [Pseudomonadota bacterium]